MVIKKRSTVFLGSFLAVLLSIQSHSARRHHPGTRIGPKVTEQTKVELTQSFPLETDLALEGIQNTKDAWIKAIQKATTSIDIGQFYAISESGEALEPVIEALESAGKRGVKIRFEVCDALMKEEGHADTWARIKKIKGIETQVVSFKSNNSGILHAKYWIFDHKKYYVGSQNFDWRSLSHIHELGIMVEPAVGSPEEATLHQIESIFNNDWTFSKNPKTWTHIINSPKELNTGFVQMVASPEFVTPSEMTLSEVALVHLISKAKREVRIQLLSYSTTKSKTEKYTVIDDALRKAAAKGVQVKLLVSSWNATSTHIEELKSLAQTKNIEVRFVTVPEFSGGEIPYARVIHSKYMTVDDSYFWIGTSNWAYDYFHNSRNIELIFSRDDLNAIGQRIHKKLWVNPLTKSVLE